MASLSFVLSEYKKKNGRQAIRLRITHKNVQYQATGFEVLASQWDAGKEKVKQSHHNSKGINEALEALYKKVEIAHSDAVTQGLLVSAKELKEAAFATHDFYALTQSIIDAFDPVQYYATKKKYVTTLNTWKEFRSELQIEQISKDLLYEFRTYLESKKLKTNTIKQRLITTRAIYNASAFKLPKSPFEKFKIGSFEASDSEPLTAEEITLIWNFEPRSNSESLAKDTFLFSFYAAGMRSEDVLTLTWGEVKDRRIVYDQAKKMHQGKNVLAIPLNSYLEEIMSRYDRTTETIFNQINKTGLDRKRQIEGKQTNINNYLKKIAQQVGIKKKITFKLARTTFADIANKKSNRNIYGIQQAMGHTKISTTEIYLGNDQSAIEELLKLVYN